MGLRNIKTILYDATSLSEINENISEYIKASLNAGQRYGERGQGIEVKEISISDILSKIQLDPNNEDKEYVDLSKANYIRIYTEDENIKCEVKDENETSLIIFDLDEATISDFETVFRNNSCEVLNISINNSSFGFNVNNDETIGDSEGDFYTIFDSNTNYEYILKDEGFDCKVITYHMVDDELLKKAEIIISDNVLQYNDYKFALSYDSTDNVYYSVNDDLTYSNGYQIDLYLLSKDRDGGIDEILNYLNDIYVSIVKLIVINYNKNYYELQYANVLLKIYNSISNIEFNDYETTPTLYSIYLKSDYKFYLVFVINAENDTNNIILCNASLIKIEFNTTELISNIITCDFDYSNGNSSQLRFVNIQIIPKQYDLEGEDIYLISILINDYDPYIGINNDWYLNNHDTGILSVGLDAGQPNILIIKTELNNSEVEATVLGSAMKIENEIQYNESPSIVELYDDFSSKDYTSENRVDNNKSNFAFLLPDLDETRYNDENNYQLIKNLLIINISDVIKTNDSEYENSKIKQVTFWQSNSDASEFECIKIDDESMNLYQLVNLDNAIDYIIDIIENGNPLDNKIGQYEFEKLMFSPIEIGLKNGGSKTIYPYITIDSDLKFKLQYDLSGSLDQHFLDYDDNGYILTISGDEEQLNVEFDNESNKEFNISNKVPTINFSEELLLNTTLLNRLNLMMFTGNTVSGVLEMQPYNAYIGTQPAVSEFDNALHIGSSTYNTNLGTNKLSSDEFKLNQQLLTDFTSDFKYNNFASISSNAFISAGDANREDHPNIFDNESLAYVKKFVSYQDTDEINDYVLDLPTSILFGDRLYITDKISRKIQDIAQLSRGYAKIDHIISNTLNTNYISTSNLDIISGVLNINSNSKLYINNKYNQTVGILSSDKIAFSKMNISGVLDVNKVNSKDIYISSKLNAISGVIDNLSTSNFKSTISEIGWNYDSQFGRIYSKIILPIGYITNVYYGSSEKYDIDNNLFLSVKETDGTINQYLNIEKLITKYWFKELGDIFSNNVIYLNNIYYVNAKLNNVSTTKYYKSILNDYTIDEENNSTNTFIKLSSLTEFIDDIYIGGLISVIIQKEDNTNYIKVIENTVLTDTTPLLKVSYNTGKNTSISDTIIYSNDVVSGTYSLSLPQLSNTNDQEFVGWDITDTEDEEETLSGNINVKIN